MPTSQGWPLRGGYGCLRFFKIVDPYPLDEKGRALELDEAGDLIWFASASQFDRRARQSES
jgi:hypothetical protein